MARRSTVTRREVPTNWRPWAVGDGARVVRLLKESQTSRRFLGQAGTVIEASPALPDTRGDRRVYRVRLRSGTFYFAASELGPKDGGEW